MAHEGSGTLVLFGVNTVAYLRQRVLSSTRNCFAVALAAKDSISNFFGTMTIFLDKPFRVEHRIIVGEHDGFVESVGYRSTRIRTFEGGLVTIPNEKMIHAAVNNVGARPHIRWHTNIGPRYDTPPDKVEKALEILKQILKDHEGMDEERPPRVYFDGLKDGTFNITLFAWYHPPEYWDYMAWVEANSLAYLRRFHEEGIRLAIPSRMVYIGPGSADETARSSGE